MVSIIFGSTYYTDILCIQKNVKKYIKKNYKKLLPQLFAIQCSYILVIQSSSLA